MNKTLMLVICDFLLLSMLALARFDPPEEKAEPALDATASSATAEAELIELLEESLHAEQGSRENLSSDLQATREDLQDKARRLVEREAALAETLANLEKTSAEAEALARAKAEAEQTQAKLAAEREELAQRFEATREELQRASEERIRLADTLGSTREARSLSDERLKQAEEALRQREAQLAQREAELRAAQIERKKLAQQQAELNQALEVAQSERRLLSENLTKEQREKQEAFARAERLGDNVGLLGQGVSDLGLGVNRLGTSVEQIGTGVDKIGTGVSQLGQEVSTVARSSKAIQKEIEAARPHTMSEIFTRFQQNRATLRFNSREQGLFGGSVERSYESRSILIDGPDENVYLVTHSDNSPFNLSRLSRIESVTLTVTTDAGRIRVRQVGFLATDPRLIFIPLPKSFVENSGLETFPLALQPERWEEAVLIKNDESNFGRTEFRRLTSSASFLKMERPALGELFADFAASRGDLAFTKNSQFIGLLTDTRHAVVLEDFVAGAVMEIGKDFEPVTAQGTIEQLRERMRLLPSEVQ